MWVFLMFAAMVHSRTITTAASQKSRAAAFSPTGQHVAYSDSQEKIHVWDVQTQRVTHMISWGPEAFWYDIFAVAFSPDGQRIAFGSFSSGGPLAGGLKALAGDLKAVTGGVKALAGGLKALAGGVKVLVGGVKALAGAFQCL